MPVTTPGMLAALLKSRTVRIAAVLLLLAGGVAGFGHQRYRVGYADGVTHEGLARDTVEARARIAAELAKAEQDAREAALRNRLAEDDRRLAALAAQSAVLGDRYERAKARFDSLQAAAVASGDTVLPPRQRACEEMAGACAIARASLQTEKSELQARVARADSLAAVQQARADSEPQRTRAVVTQALAQQRAAFKTPSRSTWALIGATVGTVTTLIVQVFR